MSHIHKYIKNSIFLMLILVGIWNSFDVEAHTVADQTTHSSGTSIKENLPYINPTPGEIPIVASSAWLDEEPASLSRLSDVKACGFNVTLAATTLSYFNTVSPYLKKLGLKAIVGFPEFSSLTGRSIIDTLKNNPVIGGWRICDEPRAEEFSKWKKVYDYVAQADPTHIPYINLVGPEAGSYFLGECKNFQTFLNEFQHIFKPAVWSYDTYPISVKNGKLNINYGNFYEAFEIFSKLSKITQRPFWAYCQSMSYKNKSIERPAATLSYLSFEAFSALGYGAKGIVYWTYSQRRSHGPSAYLSALVDLNGKKTKAWYAARQVNGEIQALKDVFLNTQYVDTWHTGGDIPSVSKRFFGNHGCLKTISGGNKGFQISLLESVNFSYIVIVNKDVQKNQKINISFLDNYAITLLTPTESGENYIIKEKNLSGTFKQTIAPGRYLILRYNKT